MNNFWEKLKKTGRPILVLAPMAGITDSPFRQICKDFGADVVVSEMASVAALAHSPTKTLAMLTSVKKEKPYVVQLFGSKPEQFAKAVKFLNNNKKIKIDGFDINFGCPVAKVLKQGAGSALFKDLVKSREVIEAVLNNTKLPVSVKIRSKVGSVTAIDFLKNIQDLPVAAVMIHGRTLTQGFSGEVDYKTIKEARQHFKGVIIANGGVNDLTSAKKLLVESGADGLGLARGVLGKPWLFQEIKHKKASKMDVKKIILKHAKLVEKYNGNFGEFRKHLCWYATGLPKAKELRNKFVKINNLADIKAIIKEI
jgi:tRNA-dihydrouridine synthase B